MLTSSVFLRSCARVQVPDQLLKGNQTLKNYVNSITSQTQPFLSFYHFVHSSVHSKYPINNSFIGLRYYARTRTNISEPSTTSSSPVKTRKSKKKSSDTLLTDIGSIMAPSTTEASSSQESMTPEPISDTTVSKSTKSRTNARKSTKHKLIDTTPLPQPTGSSLIPERIDPEFLSMDGYISKPIAPDEQLVAEIKASQQLLDEVFPEKEREKVFEDFEKYIERRELRLAKKRGDFTDFGAIEVKHNLVAEMGTELKKKMDQLTGASADSTLSQSEDDQAKFPWMKPTQPADLGLTKQEMEMISNSGPNGENLIKNYMATQPDTEKELARLKYGSTTLAEEEMKSSELSARRVADILRMPVYGPTPYLKGRSTRLFSDEEEVYFSKFPRTPANYNKFIWSLCKTGKYDKAKYALEQMKVHGVPPDVGIYTSLLQGCLANKDPEEAMRVFVEMKETGIEPDLWTFSSLMEIFISSNQLEAAFALYDELKPYGLKPTTEIFTSLVKGCIRDKDLDRAWKVFDHMRVWHCQPDEIMMNLMIHACAVQGEAERAMKFMREMIAQGLKLQTATYNSLLFACVRRRDFYKKGFDLLREMKMDGYLPDRTTLDMLLAIAGKGGDIQTAELLFDEIRTMENVVMHEKSYAYMIEAYAMGHRVHAERHNWRKNVEKAEKLFDHMIQSGIKPTAHSLNMRLNLYTFHSRTGEAVRWKDQYRSLYNVEPDVYTYNSLIELFGRTRKMEIALDYFHLMKAEGLTPNFTTYTILIEGCTRSHMANTGMKLIREMHAKDFPIVPNHQYLINFRRELVRLPDLIREIDQISGKAFVPIPKWRQPGRIRKLTYYRELTKDEAKRTGLYG